MKLDNILFISDLDGTLLNENAELTEYAKLSLNAMIMKGLKFSVSTARTAISALKILEGVQWNTPFILSP